MLDLRPQAGQGPAAIVAIVLVEDGLGQRCRCDPDPARPARWLAALEGGGAALGEQAAPFPHGADMHAQGGGDPCRLPALQRQQDRPCAICLGAVVFAISLLLGPNQHWAVARWVELMILINVVWGACNLVPMLPWDGGHALHGALDMATGGKGLKPTAVVTIVTGVVIAALLLYYLPENCNPPSRMMYAGAVELMRNTAEVQRVIEVESESDVLDIEKKLSGSE